VSALRVAVLVALAAGMPGCRALDQAVAEHEENVRQARKGPAPVDAAPAPKTAVPDVVEGPSGLERLRDLPLNSPELQLRDLLRARIRCVGGECAKRILDKIREDQAYLSRGLAVLLDGEPPPLTIEAIRVAGLLKLEAVIHPVGILLADDRPEVRAEAIWALGAIGSEPALAELGELKICGIERAQRPLACQAVADIGLAAGVGLIGWLVTGADPAGRAVCTEALAKLPGEDAVAKLEVLANDAQPEVRETALRRLRSRPEPRAKAFLEKRDREKGAQRLPKPP
jgi:hypothetical protein